MIYLTKRDPERNMARFYALDLQPTLFGGWAVVKEWGRIGRAGQGRSSLYGERAEAEAGLAHELQRRIRRGYKRGAVLERGELSALKEKSRICKAWPRICKGGPVTDSQDCGCKCPDLSGRYEYLARGRG